MLQFLTEFIESTSVSFTVTSMKLARQTFVLKTDLHHKKYMQGYAYVCNIICCLCCSVVQIILARTNMIFQDYIGNNSLVCEFINMKLLICYSTTNLFSGTLNINGNDLLFFMRVFFFSFCAAYHELLVKKSLCYHHLKKKKQLS